MAEAENKEADPLKDTMTHTDGEAHQEERVIENQPLWTVVSHDRAADRPGPAVQPINYQKLMYIEHM